MNSKIILTVRKVLIVLLIIWMVGVFLLSNQKGPDSSGLSKKVALILTFGNEEAAANIEPLVRKVAHIIEYAIGAMIFYGILSTYQKISLYGKIGMTIAFVLVYAGLDELHQSFIDDRNASLLDVGIDTIGGALGVGACFLLERMINFIDDKVQEELQNQR